LRPGAGVTVRPATEIFSTASGAGAAPVGEVAAATAEASPEAEPCPSPSVSVSVAAGEPVAPVEVVEVAVGEAVSFDPPEQADSAPTRRPTLRPKATMFRPRICDCFDFPADIRCSLSRLG
jgi:hypothetical protein